MQYEPPRGLEVPVVDPTAISTSELLARLGEIIGSVPRVEEELAATESAKGAAEAEVAGKKAA